MFQKAANYIKLIIRLLRDRRVSPYLKLIPLVGLVYLVNPLDFFIPFIDDAIVLWLSLYLFVELAPPGLVLEHRQAIKNVIPGEWRDIQGEGDGEEKRGDE